VLIVLLPVIGLLTACGPKGASEYNAGVQAHKLTDYAAAVGRFDAAIAANPDFTEAYYNRSQSTMQLAKKAAMDRRAADAGRLWRSVWADRRKVKELADRGQFVVLEGDERETLRSQNNRALEAHQKPEKFGAPTDEQIMEILGSAAMAELLK
jgi:hypothetical protein